MKNLDAFNLLVSRQLGDRKDLLKMTWGKDAFSKTKKRVENTVSQTEAYLKVSYSN